MNALHHNTCHPVTELLEDYLIILDTSISERFSGPLVAVGDCLAKNTVVYILSILAAEEPG